MHLRLLSKTNSWDLGTSSPAEVNRKQRASRAQLTDTSRTCSKAAALWSISINPQTELRKKRQNNCLTFPSCGQLWEGLLLTPAAQPASRLSAEHSSKGGGGGQRDQSRLQPPSPVRWPGLGDYQPRPTSSSARGTPKEHSRGQGLGTPKASPPPRKGKLK